MFSFTQSAPPVNPSVAQSAAKGPGNALNGIPVHVHDVGNVAAWNVPPSASQSSCDWVFVVKVPPLAAYETQAPWF